MSFGDGHTCYIEGIGTIRVKIFDKTVRELHEVRYVPQLKKNLISVRALKAQGLRGIHKLGILKMSSGSLVVLKGIQRNNL